jgi:metallophosphoesterase (TIGR00282 family)
MKVLFIGDIVGDAGRKMVRDFLPALKAKHAVDVVIVNVENMAGGFGITPETVQEIYQSGAHVLTGGNHSFDKKEGIPVYEEDPYCLRPANYPPGTPGRGHVLHSLPNGKKIAVVNLMGRTFMDPLDCPFRKVDEILEEVRKITPCVFIDFHGEATSEKMAMGWHVEGRASVVVGTHTHVQTADERLLPGGTAFITDVGMTGPYDSVIGMKKEGIVEKFISRRGKKFETASQDPWLCGIVAEIEDETGHAVSIERVRIERQRPQTHPEAV